MKIQKWGWTAASGKELGAVWAWSAVLACGFLLCIGNQARGGLTFGDIPGVERTAINESAPETKTRVVAVCIVPGAKDRFVITSDSRLVQIDQAGEVNVIGVVTAPTSDEYRCMIKTDNSLVGVTSNGHLVNTENGEVVGALVAVK